MTVPQLIDVDPKSTGEGVVPYWLSEISRVATGAMDRSEIKVPDCFAAKWSLHGTGGSLELYKAISHAPSTAGLPDTAEIRTINSLKLEKRVSLERDSTQIDEDFLRYADAAVRDALSVIRRHNLSEAENVMISDDGILSIQWRKGNIGAAMCLLATGRL